MIYQIHQKGHSLISVIITILVTALVAGYGVYYYMKAGLPQQEDVAQAVETDKEDYNLLIKQSEKDENTVLKLKSVFPKGADFKLEFPWHWGLVTVDRMDFITTTDAPLTAGELRQYVGYKFTSGTRPGTHYFTIYVSNVDYKEDELVTQGGRVFLAEDESYFYNYTIHTRDICSEGVVNCPEEKAAKIIDDIDEVLRTLSIDDIEGVIGTFEMLK